MILTRYNIKDDKMSSKIRKEKIALLDNQIKDLLSTIENSDKKQHKWKI